MFTEAHAYVQVFLGRTGSVEQTNGVGAEFENGDMSDQGTGIISIVLEVTQGIVFDYFPRYIYSSLHLMLK